MVYYFWMDFIPLCCGRIFFLTFCFYLNQVNKNGFRFALHNFSLSIIGDKVSRLYRIQIIYFCSLKNFILLLVQNRVFSSDNLKSFLFEGPVYMILDSSESKVEDLKSLQYQVEIWVQFLVLRCKTNTVQSRFSDTFGLRTSKSVTKLHNVTKSNSFM